MGLRDRLLSGIRSVVQTGAAVSPADGDPVGTDTTAPAVAEARPEPRLKALDDVASKARSLRIVIPLQTGRDPFVLEVVRSSGGWVHASGRGSKGQAVWETGRSLGEVMKRAAEKSKGRGVLDACAVTCRGTDSPVSRAELKRLGVEAVYEAFGQEPPSPESLARQQAARKVAAKAEQAIARAKRKELLALLAGGPQGVEEWGTRRHEAEALAPLSKVDLSGADLRHARLVAMPEGSFVGARLDWADLSQMDFGKSSFRDASLRDTKLAGADFRKADFTGADLEGAVLARACLQGATLTGAKLGGAVLQRTQFDAETVWPAGFTLPEDLCWTGSGPSPAALAAIEARRKSEGPIDLKTLMERLEKSVEKARMDKALSMLKSDRFKLFAEVGDARLAGVVKSQSDPALVYSCSLAADGRFGCCTQNLNVCGGLRGAMCKHLLVLAVGLAQAGQIDADALDLWVQRSALHRPALERDAMSAILLRYKGAEAGEIDWRPTETVPEDFYAY